MDRFFNGLLVSMDNCFSHRIILQHSQCLDFFAAAPAAAAPLPPVVRLVCGVLHAGLYYYYFSRRKARRALRPPPLWMSSPPPQEPRVVSGLAQGTEQASVVQHARHLLQPAEHLVRSVAGDL